MNKIIGTLALTFCILAGNAQKVMVVPVEKEVDKVMRKGMAINLVLDDKFVDKAWSKKLKEFGGKSGSAKGANLIEGATISQLSADRVRIMTGVEKGKNGTEVWWVLDLGSEYVTQSSTHWNSASNILKDFGIQTYRDDIAVQIADAEKEYEKSVKNHEKSVKDGEDMKAQIVSNNAQIEKLKAENTQLESNITTNKSEQEGFKKDIETMKKKVEETKKKLELVN